MKTTPHRFDPFSHFAAAFLAACCLLLPPTPGRAAALTNALVNNPAADGTARDTQLETTIVLGAGKTVFSAYVDSGSWDGVAGGANDHFIGLSTSLDGGTNWLDLGTLPATIKGDGMNPVLARGEGVGGLADTIYLATTTFGTSVAGPDNLQVFTFNPNGLPFLPNLAGMVNAASGSPGARIDRPALAVDNFPGPAGMGPLLGQGTVYLAWRSNSATRSSIWLAKSVDGGNTFFIPPTSEPVASLPAPGYVNAPSVVVGADHAVHVFWLEQATAGTTPNMIKVRRYNTLTDTFPNPAVTVVTMDPANTALDGDLRLQSGFSGNSFPRAVASPTIASQLVVAYNDKGAGADRADVFLVESGNGGANWFPPVRMNNDTGSNDQFGPAIAATPDGARFLVSFYDRRRDPRNINIDTFGRILDFTPNTPNFLITTESFPPVTDQDPGLPNATFGGLQDYYMGSYDGAVADNDFFYYTWGDNRLSHQFTGGRHDNQPDVRFAKIPVLGPGGILDVNTEGPAGGLAISGGNGNGVIDFNECNSLTVTLRNRGNATVNGISATLESLTPGVGVSQDASVFADIAPGATTPSVMPYTLTTSPSFVCGTVIRLRLTVTTFAAGTFVIPIQLNSGTPGALVNFPSLDPIIPIPDADGYTESRINVSGLTAPISSVRVKMWLTHTFVGDLDVSLEGPDGTRIVLTSDNGGAGDDYGVNCDMPTLFDDAAATEITFGTAPFAGPFRPEQPLTAYTGKSGAAANGIWKLLVRDDDPVVVGDIQCWSLDIRTATCTDGGGQCLTVASTQVNGGNANGRLDPNECAEMIVNLRNTRTTAFLGVTATLLSQTPGVTVMQPNSAYPNIPGLATRANLTPFKVSVAAGFPCGQFVDFVLRVTTLDDGTFDIPFRVQVQIGGCIPTVFEAGGPQVPLLIPDGPAGMVDSIIPVSGIIAPIGKVTVSVGIKHTFVRDLIVSLLSPDGTEVILAMNPDGGGDDLGLFTGPIGGPFVCDLPTTFDDEAGQTLLASLPPYAGSFVPDGPAIPASPGAPLFAFSGKSGPAVNGNWRLRIRDTKALEAGQLICWSLGICQPKSFVPTPGSLPARIDDLLTNHVAIPVSGVVGPLGKVRVALRIGHTWVEDLDISLTAPDGTTVDLSSDNGGLFDNYGFSCAAPTVFDDDSATAITAAVPMTPFATGTFRPEDPLSRFAGKSDAQVNGTWILHIADDVATFEGQLDCVRLDLFTSTCSDGGGACPPNRTLSVGSLNPASGVAITVSLADIAMQQNGTTAFTRTYANGASVTLTAPATALNGNMFLRWRIGGVDQPPGQAAITVTLNSDLAVTAVYVGPSLLTVGSLNPASLVPITVTPADNGGFGDGATPFTRLYNHATSVTLTAPLLAPNNFVFVRWRIDGVPHTPGLNAITVIMDVPHTVLAEYERPTRNLRVESDDPDSGVPIVATVDVSGNGNGVTTFIREYNKNTTVTLTAPLTEPGGRLFKKWEIDDDSQPQGQNTITLVMNADRKVEAKYMSATVELEIDSEDPDSGVDITVLTPDILGRTSGTTEFKREYNRYSTVTLIAPPVAGGRLFKRWEVDDDDQPNGQRVITVFMDEDIEVEAEYGDPVPAGATSFALWFDAFNDQARVPSSPSLRITGSITVEAWIRLDVGGIDQTIVEKSGCVGEAALVGGYALGVNAANKLIFQTKDDCALASTVTGGTVLAPGTWYHVAGVWNGAQLLVYVNGVIDGTLADLRNPKLGDTPLIIGSSGNLVPFQTFAGFIDEVRVWSVARSAADLTANMGGCLTGSQPGLAGYWRLNQNNTVVIHDSSINGNNGLLSGAILAGSPVACALPSPLPIVAPRAAPAPPAALRLTMSSDMTGHTCKLTVTGDAGKMVMIEVSKDLQNWAPLVCCTNVTGALEVSDPMDPGVTKRFFRVRQEP